MIKPVLLYVHLLPPSGRNKDTFFWGYERFWIQTETKQLYKEIVLRGKCYIKRYIFG